MMLIMPCWTLGSFTLLSRDERARRMSSFVLCNKDHNCAESALLAISEEYGLGLGPEEMKLVSAFGGGMG
ncbi:MAG: hypothetical protein IJL71_03935, partial [Oscillospiraceae bacterium]|nr:hypothetical protein [Oscillospiraceae bacterium]